MPGPFYSENDAAKEASRTIFSRCEEHDLDPALAGLLKWCVKNNAETVAFQRAERCGAVPDSIDPLDIPPLCFYGDRSSVFRRQSSETSPLASTEVWQRTNFPRVLHEASVAHPRLAELLNASLLRQSADADPALARRAAHAKAQSATLPPLTAPAIESKRTPFTPASPR